MKRAAQLGKIVAVHAESESLTQKRTREHLARNETSIADYLDSRPIQAELDAISRALEMAGETGCALHIVHVSSGTGIGLISTARRQGVDVTCETCPHYLALTDKDVLRLGAVAKCAPPLRAENEQDALWNHLEAGEVTTIGSDHSPVPPEMKTDANFFKVWGGISGVQHTLPLLISDGHEKHRLALPLLARLTCFNVAQRFKLPAAKGRIAVGADADLALIDVGQTFAVELDKLFYRHRQSPYVGRRLTGKVVQTILRGQTVCKDGKIVSKPMGRLIKLVPQP